MPAARPPARPATTPAHWYPKPAHTAPHDARPHPGSRSGRPTPRWRSAVHAPPTPPEPCPRSPTTAACQGAHPPAAQPPPTEEVPREEPTAPSAPTTPNRHEHHTIAGSGAELPTDPHALCYAASKRIPKRNPQQLKTLLPPRRALRERLREKTLD